MGVARSSFYAEPEGKPRDEEIVAGMRAITDEFEGYGYRRVGAELRHRGIVVNAKKARRLMTAHDLNPRRRRRFVRTTDSDLQRSRRPDLPVRRQRLRGAWRRPVVGRGI